MRRPAAACTMVALLTLPAAADSTRDGGGAIRLPSGAEVFWQETLRDNAGGAGLTYRFRFVMPDLAQRVPSTEGSATEPELEDRAPIDIDTETSEVDGSQDGPTDYIDDDSVAIETLDPGPEDAEAALDAPDADAEKFADAMIDEPPLPAAPDALSRDPVHDDVVWLCENWVLPRIATPGPRPSQIVISIADKATPFGTYDPDVLQLFEAFRLPDDGTSCEWEPW